MAKRLVTCYGMVRTKERQQEWYCSKSNHARFRAKELRDLGYQVTTSPMGIQRTPSGMIRMTLLTIYDVRDHTAIPAPYKVIRW